MKRILIALALLLCPALAQAQCNGVFPNNTLCGNISGAGNLPRPVPNSALTGVPGGTNGQTQFNNSGAFGGYTPSGDIAVVPSTGVETIQPGVVSNSKLATMPQHTIKGNNTSSTGAPLDLTDTQATAELNAFVGDSGSGGTKGLVPAPSAGDAAAGKFLSAAGGFVVPGAATTCPNGFLCAKDYGVKCDNSTNDFTAMTAFYTALATNSQDIGIIQGPSAGNTTCIMGDNTLGIPPGSRTLCAINMVLKFAHNAALIQPLGGASGRTFRGMMDGCGINGTSRTTFSSSVGISTLNGTDWKFTNMQINNVGTCIYVTNTDPTNFGSNYNRFTDNICGTIGNYGIRIDGGSNSNNFIGNRIVDTTYGVLCAGDQNTFEGISIETFTATGFDGQAGCVSSVLTSMRFEGGVDGIKFESGANANLVSGGLCGTLSGSSYLDSGTSNVKSGGSC